MNSIGTFDPEAASLQDWLHISQNAAKVPATDPRYPEARAVWNEAYRRITIANAQAHATDLQDVQQKANTGLFGLGKGEGAIESALVGFGHGASLGLAGEPNYMAAANATHPAATFVGDALGTGATATILGGTLAPGLSFAGQGAVGGGLTMGGRGAVEAQPGHRLEGAGAGLVVGAATGYAGGKIVGKIFKLLSRAGGAVAGQSGGGIDPTGGVPSNPPTPGGGTPTPVAEPAIGGMPESQLRAQLAKQGYPQEAIDRLVSQNRGPVVRTGAGGATTELPNPKLEPIAGTGGRGFTAEGKPTPPEPTTPTIREIVDGVSSRIENPQTPAEQVATAVRAARDQVGRSLTPQEVEAIATRNLSALGRGKTLPYYSRGGAAAETIIPGQQSPPSPGGIDRMNPTSIVDLLQTQAQFAKATGQQVTEEQLGRYLGNLDSKTLAAVHNELLARVPK